MFSNPDSQGYARLAQNMVEHRAFSQQTSAPFTPDLQRTPGYPLFLAALYVLAGHQHDLMLIVSAQILLSLATLWLVMRMGEQLISRPVGIVAGVFYALAPAALIFVGLALTETLFAFLLLTALYLLMQGLRTAEVRSWSYVLGATVFFAAAAYTRPIALYFLPVLLVGVLVWRGKTKRIWYMVGVMLICYALMLAPWFWRNAQHFGVLTFSSIGDGNLLIYNVASIEAHRQGISWREAKDQMWAELERRMSETGSFNEAERSRLMRTIALEHVAAHPVHALLYQSLDALNTLRPGYSMSALLLHGTGELGQGVQSGDWLALWRSSWGDRWIFLLMTLYYGVFYLCIGVGSVVALARQRWELMLLGGMTAFWFMYAPGIAGNARFRAPVEGLLALFAAMGAMWLWTQVRGVKWNAARQRAKTS